MRKSGKEWREVGAQKWMGGMARRDERQRQASSSCPHSPPDLLLVATLVLLNHLDHLSLGRSLPATTAGPGMFKCLNHSQNLLKAVSNTLQKVRFSMSLFPLGSLSSEGATGTPGHLKELQGNCGS